jgi:hypothetical protein
MDHLQSSHTIITYDHHLQSSLTIITYDHHLRSSLTIITYDHHLRSSLTIIIYDHNNIYSTDHRDQTYKTFDDRNLKIFVLS